MQDEVLVVWLVHLGAVSFEIACLCACCTRTSTKPPRVQHSSATATVIQVIVASKQPSSLSDCELNAGCLCACCVALGP